MENIICYIRILTPMTKYQIQRRCHLNIFAVSSLKRELTDNSTCVQGREQCQIVFSIQRSKTRMHYACTDWDKLPMKLKLTGRWRYWREQIYSNYDCPLIMKKTPLTAVCERSRIIVTQNTTVPFSSVYFNLKNSRYSARTFQCF